MQVLAEELENLKRQRAQMRAASRALAQQEKNVKKRRARLLQAVFFEKIFLYHRGCTFHTRLPGNWAKMIWSFCSDSLEALHLRT